MRRWGTAATKAAATAAAVPAAALGLLVANPAAAVQPVPLPAIVSARPADNTPHVLDGEVRAVAEVGNIGIAGGTFTRVQNPDRATTFARQNLFAFDLTTGRVLTGFTTPAQSTVYSIVPAGDGVSAFVAGQFDTIGGVTRTSRLARVNVSTGAVITSFVSPGFNGTVKQIVLRNGRLYAGGTFTRVGSAVRTSLALLDPRNGILSSRVNIRFAGLHGSGGPLGLISFDVSPNGGKLVAIGNFTSANGLPRDQIAVLDVTLTTASVSSWATTRFAPACAAATDTYMRDVDIDASGAFFVVGTTGAFFGGATTGVLCDAASRWELNVTGAGRQPTWVDYTGGDTITKVAMSGPVAYIGGHFRWFNNPFAADAAGPGAVAREGLAALDRRNGMPVTWNPGRARGYGVYGFLSTARGLWVASDTDRIGANYFRGRIALFSPGGSTMPKENTGTLPGSVYVAGAGGTDALVRHGFTGTRTAGSPAPGPGGVAWSRSRGAFMMDGVVYSGTDTGTLEARTFDGTTFGQPTTLELNGLTNVGLELAANTGMFFDHATARLYFTLAGTHALYYRYYEPESRTVGAVRFTAVGTLSDLDWSKVRGMFLNGGYLYAASSADGNLRRYTWNSAAGKPVAGTGIVVSGPKKDGQDWRARGVFVMAP